MQVFGTSAQAFSLNLIHLCFQSMAGGWQDSVGIWPPPSAHVLILCLSLTHERQLRLINHLNPPRVSAGIIESTRLLDKGLWQECVRNQPPLIALSLRANGSILPKCAAQSETANHAFSSDLRLQLQRSGKPLCKPPTPKPPFAPSPQTQLTIEVSLPKK